MENKSNAEHVNRKTFIYFLPFFLLLTTSAAFYFSAQFLGKKAGYFSGFLFYWIIWCFVIPVLWIGKKGVADLFKVKQPFFGKNKIRNMFFLFLPLILVYSYEFPKVISHASVLIVFASAGLSMINATAEEILWRGTFLKIMGDGSKFYTLFSSFGFAIWHFAPQIIFSNKAPGGQWSFVAVAFVLGFLYSQVAKDTKSILLIVIAHILFDFSGLGARIYF
jgi:membrane protease YdiL (CAAX protease family)